MKDLWERIEKWLSANASGAFHALNPPALDQTIVDIERKLGVPLPDEFKESMRIHDGQVEGELPVFPSWELLCSSQILHYWMLNRTVTEEEQRDSGGALAARSIGPVRSVWWDPVWVPFADKGAGDDLCLDLHPPDDGGRGQIIEFVHNHGSRTVVSPNFRAWLSNIADEMERGEYAINGLGFPSRRAK